MDVSMQGKTGDALMDVRAFGATGSFFETRAETEAGSTHVKVAEPGDFKVGQQVLVAHCNPHFENAYVYGPTCPSLLENRRPLAEADIALRGFAQFDEEWQTFVLHIVKADPVVFSWLVVDPRLQPNKDSLQWQGCDIPASRGWQPLLCGVDIRFGDTQWQEGQVITFHARSRLVTHIKAIEGNTFTLEDAPSHSNCGAVVRHLDQEAVEAAMSQANLEHRTLHFPVGVYRLVKSLVILDASCSVEGESPESTILDISDGTDAIFTLIGGKYFAARRLHLRGHTGHRQLAWDPFDTKSGFHFWPTANQQMEVKGCAAANITSTETVIFEDVWASRMASEAFYSQGVSRLLEDTGTRVCSADAKTYTKTITYHRCRVFDSASNAFNNNDFSENTNILYCHIENVHNAWEGANRFTRFIGNYVRNATCGEYGNIGGYRDSLNQLGSGQAVISGNVFEGGTFGRGLIARAGATQIVIADNHFVNFSNDTAIRVIGNMPKCHPTRSMIVKGNTIDLSFVEGQLERLRAGVSISASNVIVSGNLIHTRLRGDAEVAGVELFDGAVGVILADNIIEHCDCGIRSGILTLKFNPETRQPEGTSLQTHLEVRVRKVESSSKWVVEGLPLEWAWGHGYAGWRGLWGGGSNAGTTFQVVSFDPQSALLVAEGSSRPAEGDAFSLSPVDKQWLIHHNLISSCKTVSTLDPNVLSLVSR